MTADLVLEVSDLRVSYGRVEALHGVSLTVGRGEIVALLGANGAGKTSLLRGVSGTAKARGSVRLAGREIRGRAGHVIAGLGIGHVPEGRGTFTDLTVEENLRLGLLACGRSRHSGGIELAQIYELFPILAEFRQRPAGSLSGGQQQMLALARAMLGNPQLLLIDEPSVGLAPMVTADLFAAIATLCGQQGLAVLIAEQNVRRALALASRAYVLSSGTLAAEGTSAALREDPAVLAAYLGASTEEITANGGQAR